MTGSAEQRAYLIKDGRTGLGPVVYWMSRDQRARDNWALIHAQQRSLELERPLVVLFNLVEDFLEAGLRQYTFMLEGLQETADALEQKHIAFQLLRGDPQETVPRFVEEHDAALLITDFDPLRVKRQWQNGVAERVAVPVIEVDAHNIIPARLVSDKQEYAARTIRPKIQRCLPEFLRDFPKIRKHPYRFPQQSGSPFCARAVLDDLNVKTHPAPLGIIPGTRAARSCLDSFIRTRLTRYDKENNDPNQDVLSGLSPYLHFGQISAQRAALTVQGADAPQNQKDAFLEQLIIRRELADNFCFYNPHYDSVDGFPEWARKTLHQHRNDKRDVIYTLEQLEQGETHDDLWNAAQLQMVLTGTMHGFLRMYWAKKILEWTPDAEEALHAAIVLNDRYELDGRDPNGYAGIAWAIGGVHDHGWTERRVFGKIRFMNYNGCRRKFDVDAFVRHINKDVGVNQESKGGDSWMNLCRQRSRRR
ncbi:MAG: deoxyribodipyrimidine photo-lyase [Candidatus Omnitrophota bacterium]